MKKRKSDESVAALEETVLLAVIGLGDDAYGVTIQESVEAATEKHTSIGAIYTTLERLQYKGFVESWQGDPTPERGGRAKRYYKVTGAALDALREKERARLALLNGLKLSHIGGS